MEELKKCPFCGAEIKIINKDSKDEWGRIIRRYALFHKIYFTSSCPLDGFSTGGIYETIEQAISAWNDRV